MNNIIESEFNTYNGKLKIVGRQYISEGEKRPAIIASHGFGCDYQGMIPYCEYFAKNGYNTFTFNFCGGGSYGENASDGVSTDMNVETEICDLLTVIEYVKSLDCVDNEHINLLGFSQGGFVSGLTAARLNEAIDNLIMIVPALCIPDHARLGMLGGASYDVNNVPDAWDCPNGMRIGKQFHDSVLGMDPFLELAKYKGRVLIVAGKQDNVVNYSYPIKAFNSYEKDQCHLIMVRSGGHGFDRGTEDNIRIAIMNHLNYKKELLTVEVFCTEAKELEKNDDFKKIGVYFTGYADCENFRGTILPGAVDVQTIYEGKAPVLHADYTLRGLDKNGKTSTIHIVNKLDEAGLLFKPDIESDSEIFNETINGKEIIATLEMFEGGLTVRFWG